MEPLVRGVCPICEKSIMNQSKTAYTPDGREFFIRFNDGTKAAFAICNSCYASLTFEQVDQIVERQKQNWGQEVAAQLRWYYIKAVPLKVVKWGDTKEAVDG